jgi:SNF2 family DNA or RNA helicase
MTYKSLLNVTPHAFQERGIEYALAHPYCIIGDEMGLGKSLQALSVALAAKVDKTLVVCPAYLRENWAAEIDKLLSVWIDFEIISSGDDLDKVVLSDGVTDIIMISYHFVPQSEKLFEWATLVVADEAQNLKELSTSWTIMFHKFIYEQLPERLILLTGTPLKNNVPEWYSLLLLMGYHEGGSNGENVKDYFKTQEQFARYFSYVQYVAIPGGRVVEKYSGIKNRGRLKKLLQGKYIRRLAKDELDLPRLIRKDVVVDYRDDKDLLKAWRGHITQEDKTNTRAKVKSANVTAPFTAKYCRSLSEEREGRPILIFSDHIESADKIAKTLKTQAYTSKTPPAVKKDLLRDFKAGLSPYLVATIMSLNTGQTLTSAADVVFNDPNWVPSEMDQAIARIYRIGQKNVSRFHLIIGSKQSKYIYDQLEEKRNTIKKAI